MTRAPRTPPASQVPRPVVQRAEYLDVGLAEPVDPATLRAALDAALSPGLDILAASPDVAVPLAEALRASAWEVRLPG